MTGSADVVIAALLALPTGVLVAAAVDAIWGRLRPPRHTGRI